MGAVGGEGGVEESTVDEQRRDRRTNLGVVHEAGALGTGHRDQATTGSDGDRHVVHSGLPNHALGGGRHTPAPTRHPASPASISPRLRLRPINTRRLVRGSPARHGRPSSPSNSMCTPWKTYWLASPARARMPL